MIFVYHEEKKKKKGNTAQKEGKKKKLLPRGEERKNKGNFEEVYVHMHMNIFVNKKNLSPLSFLSILERKYVGGFRKKTLGS